MVLAITTVILKRCKLTSNLSIILNARNKATFDTVYKPNTKRVYAGAELITSGSAGKDLTGPLNIDGGAPQSFYAGMATIDAGYYNETYGGIITGINGGTP